MTGRSTPVEGAAGMHKHRDPTTRKKLSLKRKPNFTTKTEHASDNEHSDGGKENRCSSERPNNSQGLQPTTADGCVVTGSRRHKLSGDAAVLLEPKANHHVQDGDEESDPGSPGSPSLLATQYVMGRHESDSDADEEIPESDEDDVTGENFRQSQIAANTSGTGVNRDTNRNNISNQMEVVGRANRKSEYHNDSDDGSRDPVRVSKRRGRKERTLARVPRSEREAGLLRRKGSLTAATRVDGSCQASTKSPPCLNNESPLDGTADASSGELDKNATGEVLRANISSTQDRSSGLPALTQAPAQKIPDAHTHAFATKIDPSSAHKHDRAALVELILRELAEREGFAHFACSTHGSCVEVQLPVLRIKRLHYNMPCQSDQKLWCAKSVKTCKETTWLNTEEQDIEPMTTNKIGESVSANIKSEETIQTDAAVGDFENAVSDVGVANAATRAKLEPLPESLSETRCAETKDDGSESDSMPQAMNLCEVLETESRSRKSEIINKDASENAACAVKEETSTNSLLNRLSTSESQLGAEEIDALHEIRLQMKVEDDVLDSTSGDQSSAGTRKSSRSGHSKTPRQPRPDKGVKQRSTTEVTDLEFQTPRSQRLKRRRLANPERVQPHTKTPAHDQAADEEQPKQEPTVTSLSTRKASKPRGLITQNRNISTPNDQPRDEKSCNTISIGEEIESYPCTGTGTGTSDPRTVVRTGTRTLEAISKHSGSHDGARLRTIPIDETKESLSQLRGTDAGRGGYSPSQAKNVLVERSENGVEDDSQWDQLAQSVVRPITDDIKDYLSIGPGGSLNTQALYDMIGDNNNLESPTEGHVNPEARLSTLEHTELGVESSVGSDHTSQAAVACPMCNGRYPSAEIQSHAANCDGPDSGRRRTIQKKSEEQSNATHPRSKLPVDAIDISDDSHTTVTTNDASTRTYNFPSVLPAVADTSDDLPTQSSQWIKPQSKRPARFAQNTERSIAPPARPDIPPVFEKGSKGNKTQSLLTTMFTKLEAVANANKPRRPYAATLLQGVALNSRGPTNADVQEVASRITGNSSARRADPNAMKANTSEFKRPARPLRTQGEGYNTVDNAIKSTLENNRSKGAHTSIIEPQRKTRRSHKATHSTAQAASLGLDAICERTPGRRSNKPKLQAPISVDSDSDDSLDELLAKPIRTRRNPRQSDDATTIPATHIHSTPVRFDDDDDEASDPLRDQVSGELGFAAETYDPDNVIDEALFTNMSPIKGFVPLAEPHSQFLADQFGNSRAAPGGVRPRAKNSQSQSRRRATSSRSGRGRKGGWAYKRKKK